MKRLYEWLKAQITYRVDRLMSKGFRAQGSVLFFISLGFVLVISFLVFKSNIFPTESDIILQETDNLPETIRYGRVLWITLMRALDPGTMSGDVGKPWFLFAMLIVTLGGVFLISALIGILTTSLEVKLDKLRKGRSIVVEKDHTVILGWSAQIFTVINEIAIANENQLHPRIVVLANKDKVAMEDEIYDRATNLKKWKFRHRMILRLVYYLKQLFGIELDKINWIKKRAGKTTRLICRTGNPLDQIDLKIVNPDSAKSIIILSPEIEDPDPQVIKTMLALLNNPDRRQEPYHIVAAIRDLRNVEVAQLAGGSEVQLLLADDLIARITAQTCRQSGLSVVYTDLMDFDGDEIYFEHKNVPYGKTFSQALSCYKESAVLGIHFRRGREQIRPPDYIRLEPTDQLIFKQGEGTNFYLYGPGISSLRYKERAQIFEDTAVKGKILRAQSIQRGNRRVKPGDQIIVEVAGQKLFIWADCFIGHYYHELIDIYKNLYFKNVKFKHGRENRKLKRKEKIKSYFVIYADAKFKSKSKEDKENRKNRVKVFISTKNLIGEKRPSALNLLRSAKATGVLCAHGTENFSLGDACFLKPDEEWIINKENLYIQGTSLGNVFHQAVRKLAALSLVGIQFYNGDSVIEPPNYPDLINDVILLKEDILLINCDGENRDPIPMIGKRWVGKTFAHAKEDFSNLTITSVRTGNGSRIEGLHNLELADDMRLVINSINTRIYIQGLTDKSFAQVQDLFSELAANEPANCQEIAEMQQQLSVLTHNGNLRLQQIDREIDKLKAPIERESPEIVRSQTETRLAELQEQKTTALEELRAQQELIKNELDALCQKSAIKGVRYLNGRTQLHPPMNTILEEGDEIIAISEDDDRVVLLPSCSDMPLTPQDNQDPIAPPHYRNSIREPEKTLILGWNHRAENIITQLDKYVSDGSTVKVFANVGEERQAGYEKFVCDLVEKLGNIKEIDFENGDKTKANNLTRMKVLSYDHVIVLSPDTQSIQFADSRTLHTLLHIRHIASQSEYPPSILSEVRDPHNRDLVDHAISIVTEIRDVGNRPLAEATQADDFIVSDKLVSLMLAQVSEEKRLLDVFRELYRASGSEIYLKPVEDYIKEEFIKESYERTNGNGTAVNTHSNPIYFRAVVSAARNHDEVAIGYRSHALLHDARQSYGVFLNPPKSKEICFYKGDKIIVMAEDG
jgi:molybdopterin converting factor small subunit